MYPIVLRTPRRLAAGFRASMRRFARAAPLMLVPAGALVALLAYGSPAPGVPAFLQVEVLRSIGGIPPDIAGVFREPADVQRASNGQYMVFDRRGHTVYGIDAGMRTAWKIVEIGGEEGRILVPTAFDMEPRGSFVVADAPAGQERVQIFAMGGSRIGGFTLPGRATPRLAVGRMVLGGIGSLRYTGRSIVMNQPETGSLITQYSLSGVPTRSIGALRRTGHEDEADVHLALNTGLPVLARDGGFYFVFQGGVPLFRRYDPAGELLYERHIEGRELDEVLRTLPTEWPRRSTEGGHEMPIVTPTIVTAAVDRQGNLWVVLTAGYTYVYDSHGDKVRVVQFQAAGAVSPTSLFFTESGTVLVTPGGYEFKATP
jgi:hypothetical protein